MSVKSPVSTKQLIDEYFLENRHRLLDIAAFLDRLDRSGDGAASSSDFRVKAFRQGLQELLSSETNRAERVHMILSDPTTEPREALDQKAAYGAYNPARGVR